MTPHYSMLVKIKFMYNYFKKSIKLIIYTLLLFCIFISRAEFSENLGGFSPSEDHEFDGGSNIVIENLDKNQVRNLFLLGKVWGFLKYHHQKVVRGEKQWDYELFRILPKVLAAPNYKFTETVMLDWIAELGPTLPCQSCAKMDNIELQLAPDWRLI